MATTECIEIKWPMRVYSGAGRSRYLLIFFLILHAQTTSALVYYFSPPLATPTTATTTTWLLFTARICPLWDDEGSTVCFVLCALCFSFIFGSVVFVLVFNSNFSSCFIMKQIA